MEWIVCENTYKLWLAGAKVPAEFRLSQQARRELKRLRAWAQHVVEQDAAACSRGRVYAQPPAPLHRSGSILNE